MLLFNRRISLVNNVSRFLSDWFWTATADYLSVSSGGRIRVIFCDTRAAECQLADWNASQAFELHKFPISKAAYQRGFDLVQKELQKAILICWISPIRPKLTWIGVWNRFFNKRQPPINCTIRIALCAFRLNALSIFITIKFILTRWKVPLMLRCLRRKNAC